MPSGTLRARTRSGCGSPIVEPSNDSYHEKTGDDRSPCAPCIAPCRKDGGPRARHLSVEHPHAGHLAGRAGARCGGDAPCAGARRQLARRGRAAHGCQRPDRRPAAPPHGAPGANDGLYRLHFETDPYFAAQGLRSIYPYVEVTFRIEGEGHYHIPITMSANGYSTYRGN